MSIPEFKSGRLLLRQLDLSDEKEIFQLRSDEEVNRFLGRKKAITIEDARRFIEKVSPQIKNDELFYWGIVPLSETKLIGAICLFNKNEQGSEIEIGYELMPAFQGKGYASEAMTLVIDFAFSIPGIQQLVAVTEAANHASIKLLTKLNFREDPEAQKDIDFPNLLNYKLHISQKK